ncbi:helix-turn-helix domain-containing protein [Bacillus toyonensis]|uniref:Transcriptional regulator n=1 Tax=Bacillus toyonensis TaxID=155322 RepID=A0A2C4PFM7_9BACI|nr:helix-turn-helix transcriptional regulator [Bacillus toyonensis]PEK00316.1 transcriptional regulator [Bacillus toyonensis]PEK85286.1 transcriptional regulator [Bacillus toyonensis]PEL23621.1 transcriptional regulator [Bacillus toyonensis]PEO69199.1 transcriptional regulator [Bacillus toyonensis]PFY47821.1 transcriptional regulator [Bacillus toyonensis]
MLGPRVKTLRKEMKLTQQALGDKVGLKKAAISQIENGNNAPSNEVLNKMADVFDVTADYLLGRSEHKNLTMDESSKIKKEMLEMAGKIEKLDSSKQETILNMMKNILEQASKL